MKTLEPQLLVTHFPADRWVMTGPTGDVLTSECDWEKSLEFARHNDLSPPALAQAKAREFTWPVGMFEIPTEHKNEVGDHLFTDRGNLVTFDRERVTDDEIRLALTHAQEKFGLPLTLTGDDAAFTERMTRLADDMGMTILNPAISNHCAARTLKGPVQHVTEKKGLWPFSWPRFH